MSKKPLSDIANPQTRIDEFDLRVRRGGPAELIETILEGIGDVYPPLRQRAARTAADVDDDALRQVLSGLAVGERPVDVLREAHELGDDDVPPASAPVRQAACLSLRGARDDESLDALSRATNDEDADVRYQALVSLHMRSAPDDVMRTIIDVRLEDDDREVQIIAAQIIADRGWSDYIETMERLYQHARGEFELQLSFSLAELASDGGASLGTETRERLLDRLIAALSGDETIAAAARALAALDADQAREELRSVVGKWFGHPLNKVEAAAALVELGDPVGRDYLEKSLGSHRKDARGYAIRLVGKLALEDYLEDIVDRARSTSYHADTAVLALADFGGERAREVLEDIAQSHPDDTVRALAKDSLDELVTE